MNSVFKGLDQVLRPGLAGRSEVVRDLLWLLGGCLVLVATGIGLRDPWPADEPRFALIAREMVATGEWLIPHVGGDLYAQKPPLFFWLMAGALTIAGEMRAAFLLPSLLAAMGTVWLVYDIARRMWNRETGLLAALLLLTSVQFVWQARQAQIDAVLCFWTTLSLYGLLRHLILGPQWKWYAVGWFAAGLGVITKGVGFLPLLILIPFAVLERMNWRPQLQFGWRSRWLIGPLAFVAAVSLWLVPMLVAAQHNPALAAYRDEILFTQTIDRYANAWHHHEPFYYFVVEVIPLLWLPLTALLPWLVPSWREAFRNRDMRVVPLLAWVCMVVLFFSFSAGKRGVYVLPALPALAIAGAPCVLLLLRRAAVQRTFFVIAAGVCVVCAGALAYALVVSSARAELYSLYRIDVVGPLLALAVGAAVFSFAARPARGALAYAFTLSWTILIVSFWINPVMNDARSGERLVREALAVTDPERELGISMLKEQFLLYIDRPVTHFGHGRWQQGPQEAADAARWLTSKPGRQLLTTAHDVGLCFKDARAIPLSRAHREDWFIVHDGADRECVEQGSLQAARHYVPKSAHTGRDAPSFARNPF